MRTVFYDVWSPQIFVVCVAISTINCNSEWYIAVPGFSLLIPQIIETVYCLYYLCWYTGIITLTESTGVTLSGIQARLTQ